LNIWEAQFGDFANCAQVVFDQFISSGYEKWAQRSSLVVLLPHGLEGQGPEHSSARIERVLQLAARDNLRIAHPSTPASYFHLLRSQISETPRRPLLIFTPKRLLRLKAALSPREALESGAFRPVIAGSAAERTERVVISSGKIHYDLMEVIAEQGLSNVSTLRLEQLYPFPLSEVVQALHAVRACEVVWLQEEPANYGAWTWLRARLERAMSEVGLASDQLHCVSRPECSSPAGSFHQDHDSDQRRLVEIALGVHKSVRERIAHV
jgi:2-oxoglutarate dehydrogenase E1 component